MMFCTKCGVELEERDYFCYSCGHATSRGREEAIQPPLVRPLADRKIAGVCSGFARYLRMDTTLVRIIWLLLAFGLPPAGILGYIAAWILMPQEPLPIYVPPAAESSSAPAAS